MLLSTYSEFPPIVPNFIFFENEYKFCFEYLIAQIPKSSKVGNINIYHDATPYHDKEIYDEWVSPLGGKELNLAPFAPFHGQGVAASVFLMLDDSTKSQKY